VQTCSNVATGCQGVGPGISIPKQNGKYDYAGLNACAESLKKASPNFADERQFNVTANQGTEYQIIINVIDSMRETKNREPLFPDVRFMVSK
jgi:hypothetical protein